MSEQKVIIWKSSKEARCPEALMWECMLEVVGLLDFFAVMMETPKCSEILVCKGRVI